MSSQEQEKECISISAKLEETEGEKGRDKKSVRVKVEGGGKIEINPLPCVSHCLIRTAYAC